MKKIVLIASFCFFLLQINSLAQFKQNDIELNWEFSAGHELLNIESNTPSSNYTYFAEKSEMSYLYLSLIPGYYILNGLSFEPEFAVLTTNRTNPSFLVLANLSYTYLLKESNVGLFARIGYGLSNGITLYGNNIIQRISNDMDIEVLNIGAGVKMLLNNVVFIRTEIDYRNSTWTNTGKLTMRGSICKMGKFHGCSDLV